MSRLANLTIVKFLVGGSAVAITYIGLQLLSPALLRPFNGRNLGLAEGILFFAMLLLIKLGITLAVLAVYAVYVRLMEKRTLTEFSRRGAAADVRNGCLWTLLFVAVLLVPLSLHGNLVIDGINDWGLQRVPQLVGAAAMSAVCEEIFFRGLLFRLTESSLGSVIAVLLSSLLFGAAHYFNPHATIMRAIGVGLEAGLGLSALYMLTRTLWRCVAMHFTWNLITGLLSLPVSGTVAIGLFRSSLRGNELLTGGEFGVEASALVIIPGIVIGVYLLDSGLQTTLLHPALLGAPQQSAGRGTQRTSVDGTFRISRSGSIVAAAVQMDLDGILWTSRSDAVDRTSARDITPDKSACRLQLPLRNFDGKRPIGRSGSPVEVDCFRDNTGWTALILERRDCRGVPLRSEP